MGLTIDDEIFGIAPMISPILQSKESEEND
jgi:hypothetical protein